MTERITDCEHCGGTLDFFGEPCNWCFGPGELETERLNQDEVEYLNARMNCQFKEDPRHLHTQSTCIPKNIELSRE